jgi:aminopeptidase N
VSAAINGGSAFPTSHSKDYPNEIVGGMTLRDYFAAKAMAAYIAANPENADVRLADIAYVTADAMIAERATDATADRITALENKCALLAASLKQADANSDYLAAALKTAHAHIADDAVRIEIGEVLAAAGKL